MQMIKSKADQTMEGICIILSNISKDIDFFHQDVTNCGFRKLARHNQIGRAFDMIFKYFICISSTSCTSQNARKTGKFSRCLKDIFFRLKKKKKGKQAPA